MAWLRECGDPALWIVAKRTDVPKRWSIGTCVLYDPVYNA